MIYLITAQQELFDRDDFTIISVEESLRMMQPWKMVQFDTETDGKDAHINHILLAQFGSYDGETQIVVDCTTIDIRKYKELLESKLLIGQNLKFDLQFLYTKGIHPMKVYDLMIVEQFIG